MAVFDSLLAFFTITPEHGLWGVLLGSFLSATLLPGGSEALLYAFVDVHPESTLAAVALATLGNTAGGMTSWWAGKALPQTTQIHRIPHLDKVQRWGSPSLLLSWLPLVGDALCLAAGWLQLRAAYCLLFMAVGKLVRYALVAGLSL